MFDPLFLLNEKNYAKISMKQHTVKFCLPDLNQMFNNKALGVTFRTTKEKPFVIDYGEGDYRPIAFEALCRNYCLTTGTPLTQATLNKLKREDGYIIDWTLVKTTDIGVKRSVLACRVAEGVTFPYQIGNTLFYVNDKSVEHDKGDILIGVKQGNSVVIADIVNGMTFKRLFDNRTVLPCIGAKEPSTKPVNLTKPVNTVPVAVNKPKMQERSELSNNDVSRIRLQAEKAMSNLKNAICLTGSVLMPAVEVLQCYPQYKDKIHALWGYVTDFIVLMDTAYVGFCSADLAIRDSYDLYPAVIDCKEVKLHDTAYGIEFRIVSPLNLNNLKLSLPANFLTKEKTGFVWKFLFTVSDGGKFSADVNEYVLHFSIEDKIVKTACTFKSEFLIDGVRQSTERNLLKDMFLYLPWNNLFNPLLDDAYHTPAEQIHEAIRLMTVTLINKRIEYDRMMKKRLQDEAKEQLRQDWEERKNKVKNLFRGNKRKPSLPSADAQESLHDITMLVRELEQIVDHSKHLAGDIRFCNVKALMSVQKDLPAIKSLWEYLLCFVQFLDKSFDIPDVDDETGDKLAEERELFSNVIASILEMQYVSNNQYGVIIKLFCNRSDIGNQNTGFFMEFNFSVEKGMLGVSQLPYYKIRNTTPPVFMTVKVAPIMSGKAIDITHYRLGSEMYSPYGELSNISWEDLSLDRALTTMPAAISIMHNVLIKLLKQVFDSTVHFTLKW